MADLFALRNNYFRELDQTFHEINEKINFLSMIEGLTNVVDINIDETLDQLCNQLKVISQSDLYAICFLENDKKVIHFGSQQENSKLRKNVISLIPQNFNGRDILHKSKNNIDMIFLPVFELEGADDILFCVITLIFLNKDTFADPKPLNYIIDFCSEVANRLSILITHAIRKRCGKFRHNIIESFFDNNFTYQSTLDNSLKELLSFIPDWKHYKHKKPPFIQYLSFSNESDSLRISADTQKKDGILDTTTGTLVHINDSVCGTLIKQALKDNTKTHLIINPQEGYENKYKTYNANSIPQSEMVVLLKNSGKIIGVLNFEHEEPNYFSNYYVQMINKVAEIVAPLYDKIQYNAQLLLKRESSLLYSMSRFLFRLNNTYTHKTAQIKPIIYDLINDIKIEFKDNNKGLKLAEQLFSRFDHFSTLSNNFLENAPHYVSDGPIKVSNILENVIRQFDPIIRYGNHSIKFEVSIFDNSVCVRASQLLEEHIYNLIDNSITAISNRLQNNDSDKVDGLIEIIVSKSEFKDHRRNKTMGSRIHFVIKDNGTGINKNLLQKLGNYGFSTKKISGGSGYGLAAAIDYIRSKGGEIQFSNIYNGTDKPLGFNIEFFLEQFHGKQK